MPSLAGAGIEEHRLSAGRATSDIGTAISAAPIVSAIHSDTGRDAVHPSQAALRVAVGLNASGGFPKQRACEYAVRAIQAMLRCWVLQHRGVEAAVNEECGVTPQQAGGNGH